MKTRTYRLFGLALMLVLAVAVPGEAAGPPDDQILSLDQYTSEKGRTLARGHSAALRALNAQIYHCMPWVEVQKQSIGFFKPKHAVADERYLSIRLYIEQDPSPQFAALPVEHRAASMFSRYVGPLVRRMAMHVMPGREPSPDGFTVILEWLKHMPPAPGARPIHETMAVFLDRTTVIEYLAGTIRTRDLPPRTRVLAWDGETPLGALRLAAWDDNFVATYKVHNYQLEPGVTCPQ